MRFRAVVPSIYERWTEECLATCVFPVSIVDNTTTNIGVAASWNLVRQWTIDVEADHLIIMSAGIRFGARGGMDFIDHLKPGVICEAETIGWHLIAFPRYILETVGEFDTVFAPAYYEDNDMSYRMHLMLGNVPWEKPKIDVRLVRPAHGIALGKVQVPWRRLREIYAAKWGGLPGEETFKHPYDCEDLPLTFTGPR